MTTAHRQVLDALDAGTPDRTTVLRDFASTVLRRIEDELDSVDAHAVARWLTEVFERLDGPDHGSRSVVVRRAHTGMDGRRPGPLTVEVVTDDRPFLLSTITDDLERRGMVVSRAWHPIVGVERDPDGRIVRVVPARGAPDRIVVLRVEVAAPENGSDPDALELADDLGELVADIVRATEDHAPMRERLEELANDLRFGSWTAADPPEAEEAADLVDWLLDDNLVLLGTREYEISGKRRDPTMQVVHGSGLGLLRDTTTSRFDQPVRVSTVSGDLVRRIDQAGLLTVTRTTRTSTVQRRERMQYFGFTRRDETGRAISELRLLGLFTRKALAEPVRSTPVLRQKLQAVLEREDIVDGSHDEVALTSLFQALPTDELFQAGTDELHTMLVDLLQAEQHGEVRTIVREDQRTSSVSVVVVVPRDRYGPQLRERVQQLLEDRYGPERTDVEVSLGDRREALVRFLLHLDGPIPHVGATELRTQVRELTRTWVDDVRTRLEQRHGPDHHELAAVTDRFPAGYRDVVDVDDAVRDAELLLRLGTTADDLLLELRPEASAGRCRVRVANRGRPLELSAFMPVLESLGLVVVEELPHHLTAPGAPMQLHDFGVRADGLDVERDDERVAAAITAAWRGHLAVDALNELVLGARLDWREVVVVRAYRRLRRQLGTTFSSEYVNQTLVDNPEVTRALVAHFRARFDPAGDDDTAAEARTRAVQACDALTRLDHDRILRGFLELVDATVRTNAFREDAVADSSGEPYVALKLDPSRIAGIARPVPFREVFVHSPRVEGVHLRFGPVARGGLRWSDRRDDVRSEVHDLVRAQVLKNAVIVPTGAKGGFVLREEPTDPAELRDEIRRQYVTFVRGLLDVTDDLEGDEVLGPPRVRRHDGDDPYLVVAADRGTATLSDTANAVAQRYGFWLEDAFASGGSDGYDHKELGVTARGAWLAVRRHFRELGVDVQGEPFTVVGVGDMSGDVFGNGLLRTRTARLVAAFDHRDVFLDPDPDPERSFEERARLYALSRSSWQDYDPELISPGGGVFSRSARTIPLSEQVRALLRIEDEELPPPALIRAILRAPVDLLFAGGIGTYVKASDERHEDLGDRANTELRIDARELRARVVGEGANLFLTQRGRIEYARRGGNVNQDAIDNSAGVATSDVEVNLKILLRHAAEQGAFDVAERSELLRELADEVVTTVLGTVDRQQAALSRELGRSPRRLDAYGRMMHRLAESRDLDRETEVLPDDGELEERADAGAGLTRPELATLLAWSKRELKEQLLADDLPDRPFVLDAIEDQFPPSAVHRFRDALAGHRLRRELVATALANDVVDRMGITYVSELAATTGVAVPTVVAAHRIVRQVLGAPRLWGILDELELTQDPARVHELESEVEHALVLVTRGLVTHPRLHSEPESLRDHLARVVGVLDGILIDRGTADQRRAKALHQRWLIDDLVDPELAHFLAISRELAWLPEVCDVHEVLDGRRDPGEIMESFLRLGESLLIDRLEDLLARTRPQGDWARRQRDGIAGELRRVRRDAALRSLRDHPDQGAEDAATRFFRTRVDGIGHVERILSELAVADGISLDGIAVGSRAVRAVIDGS